MNRASSFPFQGSSEVWEVACETLLTKPSHAVNAGLGDKELEFSVHILYHQFLHEINVTGPFI